MRTTRRRLAALALAFLLLPLVVFVSDRPKAPPLGPPDDAPTAMVSLGDSTLSGEGAGDYVDDTDGQNENWCHRSKHAEVFQMPSVAVDEVFNLACSGANAARVGITDQIGNTEGSQALQLGRIARTHRVTTIVLAVGANDDPRFSDVLGQCLRAWFERRDDCSRLLTEDWRGRVERMVPKVEKAVRDVRRVLDEAGYSVGSYELVMQSYASPVTPDMSPSLQNLSGCPLRSGDMRWVRDVAVGELSDAVRRVATSSGARFLDLSRAGRGHEACSGGDSSDDEWFTRLVVDFDGLRDEARARHALQESFHPNARGHAAFGGCMAEFLGANTRYGACEPNDDGGLDLVLEQD
ncbi:hypothetical protein KCV87_30485 [Actinosynnema pretiosum subsp. pretiosum]|uniref:SGNH hydrolase-type esterase domain-containing protein n=2 Tax=Actinosynnema TaxID=40566 RepID=C6WRZ7_ACTMD|nr:GDSL-type esterase/lipase family protein [Actinosynnema mirum]ACU38817.1 hypothetical protein Amir_4993 [Actinosynnema mirum DSM 43827]AXX32408.1 hypothetical protein APASM_5043 [Actinosynnema pretiosum subsp. pretiosum]QUF03662.1 hypothetical protein KCV87_30485 [Actinosynnema pretiosum subsp. pretiosum]